MTTINKVQSLSAEALFDLLKKEFADDINAKLGSSLTIEFAHVYDIINIAFPEIIEGTVFTITVTEEPDFSNHFLQDLKNLSATAENILRKFGIDRRSKSSPCL